MDIKETTPPPQQRTFKMDVTQTELSEFNIAFTHMLEHEPQWYCDTQKEKVKVMRDKIRQMLSRQ